MTMADDQSAPAFDQRPALVIGGSGFVGSWIVRQLLEAGRSVRVLDLQPYPDARVDSQLGSIADPVAVWRACAGVGSVFLCAALVDWGWSNPTGIHEVNVRGPQIVVAACQALGVPRLIFTSSVDVVFDGAPIANGDERLPYPRQHLDLYGASKAAAERLVLAANGRGGLATCALRLGGVYGPGDRHRVPTLLESGAKGPIPRLGDGRAKFTHVYVANAAHAHLAAERALRPGSAVAGQAYFIVDPAPENFFTFLEPMVEALGHRMQPRGIPAALLYPVAWLSEHWQRWTRSAKRPLITRYVVASTCRDFWFSTAKAERDFGYRPIVGQDEAFAATVAWLRSQRASA